MREKYIFIALIVGVLTFGLAGVSFSQVGFGVPPNVPRIAAPEAVDVDSTFFADPFFRPTPFFAPRFFAPPFFAPRFFAPKPFFAPRFPFFAPEFGEVD